MIHLRRRNKYGAKRVELDGIKFDSQAECRRYVELKRLEDLGLVNNLEVHPRFDLIVKGTKVCAFVPDFMYLTGDERIIEDVKSKATITPLFRLKAKLFTALYHLPVRISEEQRRKPGRRRKK